MTSLNICVEQYMSNIFERNENYGAPQTNITPFYWTIYCKTLVYFNEEGRGGGQGYIQGLSLSKIGKIKFLQS